SNNEPRLYAGDILLTNLASAVTNINLSWDAGNSAGSVGAIFAVSGVAVAPVSVGITLSGGQAMVTWPFGRLLQATNLSGPWVTNAAATSPYEVAPNGTSEFFRVQVR
ncbi:MAG TPA: hypothetical protein VG077_05180, partial [Verrucomicrobiae bacterium]|nr:hypothetical protein [Verrucomicrobiae bacterium]